MIAQYPGRQRRIGARKRLQSSAGDAYLGRVHHFVTSRQMGLIAPRLIPGNPSTAGDAAAPGNKLSCNLVARALSSR
jgi:hypothetical protein